MRRFVSEAILPTGRTSADEAVHGEPSLPSAFTWRGQELAVARCERVWRGTKVDRGDTYLKRHYFEFVTPGGATAVVYFERQGKRGAPRWHLYTLEDPA